MNPVCALTIAGSDSGGGAGIQADLRTFAAFGIHGTTALTAITAQNTTAVTAVCALEPEMVAAQVEAVVRDITIAAVKTGMLARPKTIERVAQMARDGWLPRLVVDPVLVSSTGHALMEDGGVRAYREALLPFALVTTPNLREACVLCGYDVFDIKTLDDMQRLALEILTFGPEYVLLKGGHFVEGAVTEHGSPDLLVSASDTLFLDAPRVVTRNDHGTGCSMAAATVSGLARQQDVPDAVRAAKAFVHRALEGAASWHIGSGHGPIDHLGWQS